MKSLCTGICLLTLGLTLWFEPGTAGRVPLSALLGGESLSVANVNFSNWTLINLQITGNALINPALIDVSTFGTPAELAGITYFAPLDGLAIPRGHAEPAAGRLVFSYDVSMPASSAFIERSALEITGSSFFARPEARLRIIENIMQSNGIVLDEIVVRTRPSEPPDDIFGAIEIPLLRALRITTTIDVESPLPIDEARLTEFVQTYVLVPEPAGVTLTLLAVCCCAMRRRRS